ncbi:variant erythrocyte surface antigen-1 family protein [Babesia caballi]|uniref:Variant erythrocyte surface antigen-1 family protein n=1 Tax=Babesia caballi TaxID=5871 RepID=A0AAV4LL08_BABCB|nr:variant erythrocyte surface antigen-1 family protein [Babesia caballi]
MASGGKKLTDCPSNLKEAIDWILRVTGKDGQDSGDGQGNGTQQLADAASTLLEGVKDINSKITIDQDLINNLATGLAKFIGYENLGQSKKIGDGGIAVSGQPVNPNGIGSGYKLTYHRDQAKWQNQVVGSQAESTAAKIFLGCVPLCFYGLSYLYWRCSDKGNGEWKTSTLTTGHLGYFMNGQGFNSKQLSGKLGSQVVSDTMKDTYFKDFSTGLQEAKSKASERANKEDAARSILKIGTSYAPSQPITPVPANQNPTYPEYLQALCGKWCNGPSAFTPSNDNSLSALYYVAYLYFRGKQSALSNDPDFKPRRPSTIREMLYFLAALPFSPSYGALDTYISDHFKSLVNNSAVSDDPELMIPVADSSSPNTNNTLSAADLKNYLTTTCLYCPTILGRFQGNSADSKEDGEPWLHSLFSNTQFSLEYPAGAPLFNAIANHAYALQFQLSFLYQQCSLGSTHGCCWRQCKYGQSINKHFKGQIVQSHICPVKCNQAGHETSNHPQNCKHENCGQNNNTSPLQAFLTDSLSGFSVPQQPIPDSLDHLENHPPGSMCHVKMGFQPTDLRRSGSGHYIYYTLDHFCGFSNDPLRQLSEKLSRLTKRTPRTLGDMFGFVWHLNGQLFRDKRPTRQALAKKLIDAIGQNNPSKIIPQFLFDILKKIGGTASGNGPASGLSQSLEAMAPAIPFLYQMFTGDPEDFLPTVLFDLKGTAHNSLSTHPANLYSLYYPQCSEPNCGTFLSPLCYSNGSAFAPKHASSYFSWVLYLIDDFEVGLREMLDEFTNIDCTKSGCHEQKCQSEHSPAQHGSSPTCQCDSVVHCAGVLPLLYYKGFTFASASMLKNGGGPASGKKSCQNFHDQLTAVLAQDENTPLFKLLLAIDAFLYMFRFYFFYNLSSFWLCSLAILLYFIFYGIGVLHLKSHVHFPSSHTVPPIGLLTTGKAPVLTKLTYYMP